MRPVCHAGESWKASLAWWFLDPDIDAEQRMARSLAYRLHTAEQTGRAVRALELGPEDDPADYGESADDVREEISSLGWKCGKSGAASVGDDGAVAESWPRYAERAAQLTERIWPQRKLPYTVLSAVAHAELLGMMRGLGPLASQAPGRAALPGQDDAQWLWQDTYLVLGALVFSADRAAAFLGLHDDLAAAHDLAERLDKRLPALRPAIPGSL